MRARAALEWKPGRRVDCRVWRGRRRRASELGDRLMDWHYRQCFNERRGRWAHGCATLTVKSVAPASKTSAAKLRRSSAQSVLWNEKPSARQKPEPHQVPSAQLRRDELAPVFGGVENLLLSLSVCFRDIRHLSSSFGSSSDNTPGRTVVRVTVRLFFLLGLFAESRIECR